MSRHLKREIKKVFEAPLPDQRKKAVFLRTLPKSTISTGQFILTQTAYLRKWVLIFSVLLFFPVMGGAHCIDKNTLWIISSFTPFLGFLAVTESTRSAMYGMSEFEMSARFSLKSVVLARMSILGLLDVLVLCGTVPFCCISSNVSVIQTGTYLLVPYLLTVNINLWITRHFHGWEAFYGCMCAAVLVSGGNWGLHIIVDFIYQFSYIHWWIILSVLLIGRMAQEIYHTIKQTEELAWNS